MKLYNKSIQCIYKILDNAYSYTCEW